MSKIDVLVVGGGGREHALVWKIAQSPLVEKVYCAPGNGGTANEEKTINVPIGVDKFEELSRFALEKKIALVVIGPDNPLADGIVDHMEAKGLKVFGPDQAGAKLESSKSHAKNILVELGIPTARFAVFQDKTSALNFASENEWARVVKEDGLALGKGVVVCDTIKEVEDALSKMFGGNAKDSSATKNIVVVEDRLQGEELSLFLLSDGKNTLTLAACQDHKRRFDGDTGPNTGGMGAYSPVPLYEKYKEVIEKQVVEPIQRALKNGSLKYKGVLFIGILMQDDIPYVLEFNARFGDPETQALMPRLKSDIVPALLASAEGTLDQVKLDWDTRFSCCVVACADKYPESSSKGETIEIGELPEDTYIFHAGTAIANDVVTTNGGRVLAVVSLHEAPEKAQQNAYLALKNVSFKGIDYRKDIAWRVATKCHSR
ncbi:MAG: phosphoribosylamine--glycine ligase [Candidatus Melainabacteria bacterium]|nr:phosphoribosylamine--glycine ligase [Candidatus Melainabacteria bacterium]